MPYFDSSYVSISIHPMYLFRLLLVLITSDRSEKTIPYQSFRIA